MFPILAPFGTVYGSMTGLWFALNTAILLLNAGLAQRYSTVQVELVPSPAG